MAQDVKEAFSSMLPRALKRLSELLDDDDGKLRHKAIETVLERNLGRAVQALEHGGNVTIVIGAPYGTDK